MLATADPFYKNEYVQDATRYAQAAMQRRLLSRKFGRLPKWVAELLEEATSVQIERWSARIFAADSLEDVLGRK